MLRRPLPVALLVTALLAGCGGDASPQTKEGFIAEADAVCEKLAGRLAQAGATDPQTPAQIAQANDVLADRYGELSDELAKVRLPDGGAARAEAQAFVASVRRADPLLGDLRAAGQRLVAAAGSTDTQATAAAVNDARGALDAFRAARAASDRRAIDYGLNICGNLG